MSDPIPHNNLVLFASDLIAQAKKKASTLQASEGLPEFTAWTRAVKQVLRSMGDPLGYESLFTHPETGVSEFMLDFVWWRKANDTRGSGAVLGCESEWGNTRHEAGNVFRVADDFDKLLSFKAPLKLMIFDSYGTKAKDQGLREKVVAELNRRLRDFGGHSRGEVYLLIDMCSKPALWMCEILKDGRGHDLSFLLQDIVEADRW